MKRDWATIVTLGIFLLGQTFVGVWWASGITANSQFTAQTVAKVEKKIDDLSAQATTVATHEVRLNQLEAKVNANEGRIRDLERGQR